MGIPTFNITRVNSILKRLIFIRFINSESIQMCVYLGKWKQKILFYTCMSLIDMLQTHLLLFIFSSVHPVFNNWLYTETHMCTHEGRVLLTLIQFFSLCIRAAYNNINILIHSPFPVSFGPHTPTHVHTCTHKHTYLHRYWMTGALTGFLVNALCVLKLLQYISFINAAPPLPQCDQNHCFYFHWEIKHPLLHDVTFNCFNAKTK